MFPKGNWGRAWAGAGASLSGSWWPVGTLVAPPRRPQPGLTQGQGWPKFNGCHSLWAHPLLPPYSIHILRAAHGLAMVTWTLGQGDTEERTREHPGPTQGKAGVPVDLTANAAGLEHPTLALGVAAMGAVTTHRGPAWAAGVLSSPGFRPGTGARPPQAVSTALALAQLPGHFAGASRLSPPPCLGVLTRGALATPVQGCAEEPVRCL